MDRRRFQIHNKVDEIAEEKNLLQSNLDKIINQVHACVDLVNGSKQFKQKDCSMILKYELEVLKKITEINYELECVIDESPLNQLRTVHGIEDFSSVTALALESKAADTLDIVEKQEQKEEPSHELDFSNQACSSVFFPELNYGNCNADNEETQSNISHADLQVLRNTLKKFSEKLGLNSECISSMTDFYQKSSTNCVNPSSSKISHYGMDSAALTLENVIGNGFEVPVKDTNMIVSAESALKENRSDLLQPVETSTSSDNMDTADSSSSSYHDTYNSSLVQINQSSADNDLQKTDTVDDSYSIDVNCVNVTESEDEAPHCLIPLVDENSIVICNIIDQRNLKTDDGIKQTNNVVYTALEKLNNVQFLDRQPEAMAKMPDKPDITLKPTEHRIKNEFETNKKSKKKKNKGKSQDNQFYELMPKSAPAIGMHCAFSHVESPNEFYIHIVDEESIQIDDLTEKFNEMLNGTVTEYNCKEEAFTAIGTFCFSYVLGYKSWYRSQVSDWELESKSDDVVVQLVDYGDRRRISFKNLRRMTKEMAEIPMLAVRCHLALMYPPRSSHTNRSTEWPAATIDAMVELSGLLGSADSERGKIFKIVYANPQEDSVAVDMYNLQEVSEEQTVGQILLDLGLAVQIIDEYDEEQADLELFLGDVDSLENADNINEAVMGYDPRDEARICRFTKSDGTCYKGKGCKLEHVSLSKDGFTTDQIPVFKEAMYSLPLPANGAAVNILITGLKDVCNFFAHIIWKPHKENNYMIDEDLYNLLADMNVAKTVRTYEAFKIAPAIGEIVVVKHWCQKWLRAVVREEVCNDDKVEYQVFTLDFGDYLMVPLGDLRKIKPHFLQLPFQAVECYMHNYVAREDCDVKKARKFFFENMYYRNFGAHIMSASLPLKVAVTTFDATNVGKRLVEEGFAKDRVCDKNPAEDCFLELY